MVTIMIFYHIIIQYSSTVYIGYWVFLVKYMYHPKSSSTIPFLAPWQYCLPKSAFSTTLNASNRLLRNFVQWNFLLSNYLIPSDKHNSITAKAYRLDFSLFGVALAKQVAFSILQYI